jgi:hypothetical protein
MEHPPRRPNPTNLRDCVKNRIASEILSGGEGRPRRRTPAGCNVCRKGTCAATHPLRRAAILQTLHPAGVRLLRTQAATSIQTTALVGFPDARSAATLATMTSTPILVECYAGGRSDERPRKITIDGREHTIASLLAESVEESAVSRARTRRYRVLTLDGLVLEITRSGNGDWFLDATRASTEDERGNN